MEIPARRQLATLVRDERPLLGRFVVASAGQAVMSMAAIFLINEFLSGILGGGDAPTGGLAEVASPEVTIWLVAALLLITYVAASLFRYDGAVVQQRIVRVLELGMMDRLIRHLLTLSVPFFDRQSHGDIIQAVKQDVSALRAVVLAYARLFLDGLVAASLLMAAISLSPRLTFWAIVVQLFAVVPIVLVGRRTLRRSFKVRKSGYVLYDAILQVLRGIRVIKAFGGEQEEARATVEKGRRYFDSLVEIVRIRALSGVALQSLTGVSIVVVIVLGGFEVMAGRMLWPALLAFLMAGRALNTPLNALNASYMQIRRHGAAVSRIDELLKTRREVPEAPDPIPMEHPPALITFEDVGFRYQSEGVGEDPDQQWMMKGISFTVRAGGTIGIAGPSGGGKTTLLNLLARFYDPTEGRVCFDGRDLTRYRLADVYRNLAIVTQQPFLFTATIRHNIACGRPEATFEEVVAAAKAAEIHPEIEALEDGYDTEVGIGRRQLSLGQAQRVSIARAILKGAPLLLLDEATASLDSLAETEVQRAIDRLMEGRTTFIVAHRLSTLRGADRILVIEAGRLIATGTHEELVGFCELYRRMWETQQFGTRRSELSHLSGSANGRGLASWRREVELLEDSA